MAGLLLTLAPALPAQVTEVQVTPRRFSLDVGKRRTLYAAGYDRQGNLVAGAQFTFTTSDAAVARVSSSGTVTAVGAGTATIEARSGGRRATAAVTVRGEAGPARAADLASLAIEPASVALLPLEPVRLVPRALRSDGTALALRAPFGRLSRSARISVRRTPPANRHTRRTARPWWLTLSAA